MTLSTNADIMNPKDSSMTQIHVCGTEHPSSPTIALLVILVVGYGFVNKKVYLKVRNYRGIERGSDKYAWISEDYLKEYADEYVQLMTLE